MRHERPFDIRPPASPDASHGGWVLCVSVFLSALVCCSQASAQEAESRKLPDPEFSLLRMPCGIPFECTDTLRFRNAEARWKLSFDPKLPALYDIVHWRVAYYGRAGQGGPREFVGQYVRPDGGAPHYRILQRVRVRDWKKAWLGRKWDWHELERAGWEYRTAVLELIRVFRAANTLREGAEPASLQF